MTDLMSLNDNVNHKISAKHIEAAAHLSVQANDLHTLLGASALGTLVGRAGAKELQELEFTSPYPSKNESIQHGNSEKNSHFHDINKMSFEERRDMKLEAGIALPLDKLRNMGPHEIKNAVPIKKLKSEDPANNIPK